MIKLFCSAIDDGTTMMVCWGAAGGGVGLAKLSGGPGSSWEGPWGEGRLVGGVGVRVIF